MVLSLLLVVITTAQVHSTKPELRFCAGSNPARRVSAIRDGEDLWQWSRLEIRLNAFRRSTIPQKQFIIIIIIIIIIQAIIRLKILIKITDFTGISHTSLTYTLGWNNTAKHDIRTCKGKKAVREFYYQMIIFLSKLKSYQ